MKSKKVLATLMAVLMAIPFSACGETEQTDVPPTTAAEVSQIEGVSIDFEDGQSGFVMMSTAKRKADDSKVSVKDFNGSKALFIENVTGGELYVGIDVDALLGDKVTDVRTIQMDIGTEYADGSFSASSGNLYAYTGAELTENKLDGWAVYMENKNPKTAVFNMGDATFTAGNDNYIVLVKDTDNGATASSLYIDNIVFADADGKAIAADTSVVMEAPYEGFRKEVEPEKEEASAGSKTIKLDESYAGDWGAITTIPASELAGLSGDVTVTLKYELVSGYDYYLLAPMDASDGWNRMTDYYKDLTPKDAAAEGDLYHLQADGFIVIDDLTNGTMTFTLSADAISTIVANGVGLSGQTYGVTVYEATISGAAAGSSKTLALDEAYAGDWGAITAIPASELAGLSGDVTVTLKYELVSGYDYYLLAPMDFSDGWNRMTDYYTDLTPKSEKEDGDLYHLQSDGFIVIDDLTNDTLTFTISAEGIAAIVANGVGLSGQTYGLTVYEATISGAAGAGASGKTLALDESYAGDWGAITAIPASELAAFSGDVTVSMKFELESGYDYYLLAPMDFSDGWNRMTDYYTDLTPKSEKEDGDLYHLQSDGFIVIDDLTNDTLTFTISAEGIAAIVANGVGLSGQTYGLTVYEATISGSAGAASGATAKTIALDEDYVGDWGAVTVIPTSELEAFPNGVTVTYKFELESGYDYYLLAPMDFSDGWNRMTDYYTDLTPKSEKEDGDLYHLQSDGFIVIDDLTNDTMTFTISADGVAALVANGVGLSAQTYGLTVYEAELR